MNSTFQLLRNVKLGLTHRIYAESQAKLFVESCPAQAREIHQLTGKPVIDFTNMIAHGATIFR